MRHSFTFTLASLLLFAAACGDAAPPEGRPRGRVGPSIEEVNRLFDFAPNTPMNVYFGCVRSNSRLFYQMQLRDDETFTIAAELDTGDVAFATGVYAYENDAIRLQTNPNNFILFDERTTSITPALGIVYELETTAMRCVANGHEADLSSGLIAQYYGCPEFSEGPASSQVNAFEFDIGLPGAIFRDRNRWVRGYDQPIVLRGNGIYRRIGTGYYGYFGNQFDDYSVVTGAFLSGNEAVRIDQLPDGFAECRRR